MYLISACLAGVNCKYNGGNNECQWVKNLIKKNPYKLVCPESLGDLSTPRPPSEIINGRAIDKNGVDITHNLIYGAEESLRLAENMAKKTGGEIKLAILKSNSPSCGCGKIYDGSFSGKLVEGDGFFTRLLKERGIQVITEHDEEEIHKYMK